MAIGIARLSGYPSSNNAFAMSIAFFLVNLSKFFIDAGKSFMFHGILVSPFIKKHNLYKQV